MLGLTTQNFVSAATGIALLIALIRAFARASAKTVGNFWVDLTRSTLYVLLPSRDHRRAHSSSGRACRRTWALMSMPPRWKAPSKRISQGPAASQIAIKQLGTNGGGFWNANSAIPYRESDGDQQFP